MSGKFLMTHSVPRFALLRVRRNCADPQALSPRSLSSERQIALRHTWHTACLRRSGKGAVYLYWLGRNTDVPLSTHPLYRLKANLRTLHARP